MEMFASLDATFDSLVSAETAGRRGDSSEANRLDSSWTV